MIAYGISNSVAKIPSEKIGSRRTIFWRNVMVSLIFMVFLLFFDSNFSLKYVIYAVLLGIFGYFPLFFFLKALKKGKLGVVQPVGRASVIFRVFFAMWILGEVLSLGQITSIVLIFIGAVLISIRFKDFKNYQLESGVVNALIASVLWGIFWVLQKFPTIELGPVMAGFILEVMVMVSAGIHMYLTGASFRLPSRKLSYTLFWIALTGALGTLFFMMGIRIADVSLVSAAAAGSPLVATVIGFWFFRERLRIQQYFGIALIIAGLIVLAVV